MCVFASQPMTWGYSIQPQASLDAQACALVYAKPAEEFSLGSSHRNVASYTASWAGLQIALLPA